MTLVPLLPPPGINTDDTTFAAEGRWADCSNVRFRLGKPEAIGGWRLALGSTLTGVVVGAECAANGSNILYYAGTNSPKLYRILNQGSSSADVTPSPAPGSAAHWSFAPFGSVMLSSPRSGTIYEQDMTGTSIATEVTNAPDSIIYIVATAQRQVMALGCNEEASGTFNKLCIRWCDLEDYTDWTTTSTNNAGEHIIDETGQQIVAGRAFGNYVVIWTSKSLYLATFIGDPAQTWAFEKIADGCGLVGARAAYVYAGVVYWMTPDAEFMAWAPGALPRRIPNPLQKYIIDAWGTTAASRLPHMVANERFREIWCFYDSTDFSKYVAFNIDDGSWFRGSIGSASTYRSAGLVDRSIAWVSPSLFMFSGAGKMYQHEYGTTGSTDSLTWEITSGDFYLDESQTRAMIRRFIPDFEGQTGNVSVTVNVRNYPNETATAKGPYTIGTSTKKYDFRASGKIANVKFSGTDVFARFGKQLFDVVSGGQR